MKYLSTQDIPLKDIDVSNRLRVVNEDWATGLAESFQMIGQKEPIEVVAQKKGKKYRLVAGGHRYAAAVKCDWETIRAEIKQTVTKNADLEIRLHEIDENLIRNELNALDRAVFLGERQRIYEAMYPETANGKTPGNQHSGQKRETDIVSFSQNTAEKIDLSVRTIRRYTAIFKCLSPALRAQISGTPLANKQGELYKLTRINPDHHKQIVDACLREDNPASSVSVAEQELDGRTRPDVSDEEKALKLFKNKFSNFKKSEKTAFLEWLVFLGIIEQFDAEQLA